MYFLKKTLSFTSYRLIVSAILLIIGLGSTVWVWHVAQNAVTQAAFEQFNLKVERLKSIIIGRMTAYEQVFRSGAALFNTHAPITRQDWHTYVNHLEIERLFPAILSINFAERVTAAEKTAHINAVREQGFPDYTIRPAGDRREYLPLLFVEPAAPSLGEDKLTERAHQEAIEQSRDSGLPAITGKLTLTEGDSEYIGFALYLPIYRPQQSLNSIDERRLAWVGHVVGTLQFENLMAGIFGQYQLDVDIEIYDGREVKHSQLLYDYDHILHHEQVSSDNHPSRFVKDVTLAVGGRTWKLHFTALPEFEEHANRTPEILLISGVLATVLLVILMWTNMRLHREYAARKHSEERLELAMAATHDGLWDWDITAQTVYYSPRWQQIVGYTNLEKDCHFEVWQRLIHPADSDDFTANITAYLETPPVPDTHSQSLVTPKKSYFEHISRLRHQEGHYLWILIRGIIATRDTAGKPLRMVGTIVDMTAQRVAEEELRDSERYNRTLIEEFPVGLALTRMDGTLIDVNPAYAHIIGYSIDELLSDKITYWDITPKKYAHREQEMLQLLQTTGRYGPYEKEYLHKDGRLIPVRLSGLIVDRKGERFIWSSVEDISDQRRAQALELANQQIIAELTQVFAAVAHGDLTQQIFKKYAGCLQLLKNDVNTTMRTLLTVMDTIQETANHLNRLTEEISESNRGLSQRTEEQALSLQQTAATMEQMTVTVEQNADSAQQAAQLAKSARDQAQRGGDVVSKAVAAMTTINRSSVRVADIISVIDEIAFQTNLLALNAAVEAARAGDQGRGFAVVAAEVRNLAQRSATAAKEIKQLIEDSVAQIEEGTCLVNQSGQTLEEIVIVVNKVCDFVTDIAAASMQQALGIQQVNKGVGQMDKVTQENAAWIGQTASVSQSLQEQAEHLREQVAFFHTGRHLEEIKPNIKRGR